MKRRDFVKNTAALSAIALLPACATTKFAKDGKVRTAHIGVHGMGFEDLKTFASNEKVEIVGLCDVDANALKARMEMFPNAKGYKDYRVMLKELAKEIDAVIVSTPDHTHAPASLMAMGLGKAVYCQKPLTHHISEAQKMRKLAADKKLVTQMGIQVHSFYDYKLATELIQSGIIGKVNCVRAWSTTNWGFDGEKPEGNDPIPESLEWNLWQGTAPERPYKKGLYHNVNWRKILNYGCGTLGDMGVHILDTPYRALALGMPNTVVNNCRKPNDFSFPEKNVVTYEFPGTKYTTETLKWVWYDGEAAPPIHKDLVLPDNEELPGQGAMFIGEKGKLLLPHFIQLPKLIVDGKFQELDLSNVSKSLQTAPVERDYKEECKTHYYEFVAACLGSGKCSANFDYSSKLTEVILMGVVAGRFPNQTLHWDSELAKFTEEEANEFLDAPYRDF